MSTLISDISSMAIQCSVLIWMNRNCVTWNSVSLNSSQTNPKYDSANASKEKSTPPIIHNKKQSNATTSQSNSSDKVSEVESLQCRPGLINKGNTCYMNSILQSLSVLTSYCASVFDLSHLSDHHPLVSSFLRVMFLLRSSKNTIDPSCFLDAFSQHMTNSGRVNFQINSQHDAAEMLELLLDYFSALSVTTKEILGLTVRSIKTCHSCLSSTFLDEPHTILKLSVARDVNESLQSFTEREVLEGVFCQQCNCNQTASLHHTFIKSGEFIIVQLKRFDNNWNKDHTFVNCVGYTLKLSLTDEEVTVRRAYQLVASVCHFGRYDSGHYITHVREPVRGDWLHCNDSAVLPLDFWKVDNRHNYVLFYKRI